MTKVSPNLTPALRALAAAGTVSLLLTGCGDTKKMLGFEKVAPDEFNVVARAPLSLPPEYQLRPPEPGAARPQEASTRDQAQALLTGKSGPANKGRSTGETALLAKAGADQNEPGIRSVVNRELAALAEADRTVVERLVFWRKNDIPAKELDAAKERQRLQQNDALGQSVTEGESPIIKRRRKGLLEGFF
jgi:hypothetical protein